MDYQKSLNEIKILHGYFRNKKIIESKYNNFKKYQDISQYKLVILTFC